ncbi:hypothetical protein AZL_017710 [Azospirillum sp. B510]|nr:hypothetical protein AZL_017710 [Azospirillum sp. B510]
MAQAVQHDLERAIGHGIPLARIEGVDVFLQGIAGRNPDIGFLALTGGDGALLQGAAAPGSPLDRKGLEALAASLRGLPTPETRAATLEPVERGGFLILRLPVRIDRLSSEGGGGGASRPPAGHVLVAVRPEQVRGQIAGELATVALGALALLLPLAELAALLVRASVGVPLRRLARAMEEAAAGRFATLLGRRPRDQVGRLLLSFNAVVFGLHARRQRFAAHAEEVRAAVFDPQVAEAVERTRRSALEALGRGLEAAPRRESEPRPDDVHGFALLALSAAAMLAAAGGGLPMPAGTVAVAAVGAVGGAAAGYAVPAGWRRPVASLTALLLLGLAAALLILPFGSLSPAGIVVAVSAALAGGAAAGVALSYVRRQCGGAGVLPLLRALGIGVSAAALWGTALGWDGGILAVSALLSAGLALPLARPIVDPRR